MRLNDDQIQRVREVKSYIAVLLRSELSLQEIAECLEDTANILLDISEEIAQFILSGTMPSTLPKQDPHSPYP